jgi:hypothetical protein
MPAPSPSSVQPVPGGTASEHLLWAKQRAREYLDRGDSSSAWASFVSDLRKHDELRDHAGIELGLLLLIGGHLSTVGAMRDHIEGCN